MSSEQPTILIADDDPDLREIVRCVLEAKGYEIHEAMDGGDALEQVRENPPDLLVLDYMMPRMTGLEVCAELRQDTFLRHLPVIMLTGSKTEVEDKISGLNAGADDYLLKPFEPPELLARVEMILRRTIQGLEANPLTRLPGNISIQRELEHRISTKASFAAAYIDLDQFKSFNDHYGFKRGDEVIQKTAQVLLDAARTHGGHSCFVGHIGGDDFIIITTAEQADKLCEGIVKRFDAMAALLYDAQDRKRGYLLHKDRKGKEKKVSFLSVSIALVTNEKEKLTHPAEVAQRGAELKAYAKSFAHSIYVKERRDSTQRPKKKKGD